MQWAQYKAAATVEPHFPSSTFPVQYLNLIHLSPDVVTEISVSFPKSNNQGAIAAFLKDLLNFLHWIKEECSERKLWEHLQY